MANFRRAVVSEEAYSVVARVAEHDEQGEELVKSDRLAIGFEIANRVKQCGRACSVLESDGAVAVAIDLGDDADDHEFEDAAGLLLAASR